MGEIQRFILLLLASAVVTVAARWIRLPYTLALLLLGLALGFLNDTPILQLSSDVILLLFLPPLLFEAAFVLDLDLLWTRRRGGDGIGIAWHGDGDRRGRRCRVRDWGFLSSGVEPLIELWAFLAFLANSALFLELGITVSTADLWQHQTSVVSSLPRKRTHGRDRSSSAPINVEN